MSFTNTVTLDLGPFVGFRNFRVLWGDSSFRQSVGNTIQYTTTAVFFKFVLGLTAAMLLAAGHALPQCVDRSGPAALDRAPRGDRHYLEEPARPRLRRRQPVSELTGIVERGLLWFGSYDMAMPSVIMVNIWQGIPFFAVMMLAGLSSIDNELYEAARIDGANAWRLFLHVTLPGLRYVIIVAVLLSTIWTFNDFTTVFLLTGGGPAGATRLYSILAFEYAIASLRYSMGVAVAITMAPVLAVFIFFLGRYMSAGGQRPRGGIQFRSDVDESSGRCDCMAFPHGAQGRALGLRDRQQCGRECRDGGRRCHRPGIRWQEPRRVRQAPPESRDASAASSPASCSSCCSSSSSRPSIGSSSLPSRRPGSGRVSNRSSGPIPGRLISSESLLGPTRAFVLWYKNTVLVAIVTTLVGVSVASLGAYALTRLRWRGSNIFGSLVLVAYLMPPILMFIPMYQILARLHLTNKLAGLMVTYPALTLPFRHLAAHGLLRLDPGGTGKLRPDRRL